VPAALAKQYEEQMQQPDLIFLTPENQEKMSKVIDPLRMAEKNKELALKIAEAKAPAKLPMPGEEK
jgi:hypothetical protein